MALSVRADKPTGTANATSVVINKPSGTTSGDILLAFLTLGQSLALPVTATGWTVLDSSGAFTPTDEGNVTLYRVADGTEGTSFTFNVSASDQIAGIVLCVTDSGGALTATNVDSHTTSQNTGSSTMTGPSSTPSQANAFIFTSFGCDQSAGVTPNVNTPSASSGNTATIEQEVIDTVQFVYVSVLSETQTTATASAHTAVYAGSGNATRGSFCMSIVIVPFVAAYIAPRYDVLHPLPVYRM